MQSPKTISVLESIEQSVFINEYLTPGKPVVIRGLVSQLPVVKAAKRSNDAFLEYLTAHYVGGRIRFMTLANDAYYFYNEDYSGFNFERKIGSYEQFLNAIRDASPVNAPNRVSLQSAPLKDHFPNLLGEYQMPLFDSAIEPRIWLGSAGKINSHFDDANNIACVISGKRTFTIFPPEQIENLYLGSLQITPGGAPISLAKLHEYDQQKFPKMKEAIKYSLSIELYPGDAIFIPALWWHHVESHEGVNGLINYWQGGSIENPQELSGLDAILFGLISLSKLPESEKLAWKTMFDHIVMKSEGQFDYVPDKIKGVLGEMNTASKQNIVNWLASKLNR